MVRSFSLALVGLAALVAVAAVGSADSHRLGGLRGSWIDGAMSSIEVDWPSSRHILCCARGQSRFPADEDWREFLEDRVHRPAKHSAAASRVAEFAERDAVLDSQLVLP